MRSQLPSSHHQPPPCLAPPPPKKVLCLQETKLQADATSAIPRDMGLDGWSAAFSCSGPPAKKGYSGVATFCRWAGSAAA
jgi:exonuclease III